MILHHVESSIYLLLVKFQTLQNLAGRLITNCSSAALSNTQIKELECLTVRDMVVSES